MYAKDNFVTLSEKKRDKSCDFGDSLSKGTNIGSYIVKLILVTYFIFT